MTPQQIAAMAIRLLSILLVLDAVVFVAELARIIAQGGETPILSLELIALGYIVVAALFWFFPMRISHYLIPNTKFENTIKLNQDQVIFVACVVLGLWVCVVKVLPAISTFIAAILLLLSHGDSLATIWKSILESNHLLSGLIQLPIGLALIFKADVLTKRITETH